MAHGLFVEAGKSLKSEIRYIPAIRTACQLQDIFPTNMPPAPEQLAPQVFPELLNARALMITWKEVLHADTMSG